METITVIYNGEKVLVFKTVAQHLGICDGQTIQTLSCLKDVMCANASYGISICEHEIEPKQN